MPNDKNSFDPGNLLTKNDLRSMLMQDLKLREEFESNKEAFFQLVDAQVIELVKQVVEETLAEPNLENFIEEILDEKSGDTSPVTQEDIEQSIAKAASKFARIALKNIKT